MKVALEVKTVFRSMNVVPKAVITPWTVGFVKAIAARNRPIGK